MDSLRVVAWGALVVALALVLSCAPPGGVPTGFGTDTGTEAGGSPSGDSAQGSGQSDFDVIEPGQLTAGEWNDLENWSFWLGLVGQGEYSVQEEDWGFNTRGRIPVLVENAGEAVRDVRVRLRHAADTVIWRARTDARGFAELFFDAFAQSSAPFTVEVVDEAGDVIASSEDISGSSDDRVEIDLSSAPAAPGNVVDLMFVIDTTGSMSDELEYIKAELEDVIDSIGTDGQAGPTVRLSVNFYRDEGDEYVVRSFPFTTDISSAVADLAAQSASGGGDFPEAVHSAMIDAIDDHDWSGSAKARLLFLVLDAPPHNEEQVVDSIQLKTKQAAELGVSIVPVVASGIDKPTEFLMRFMAILTNGTYVFLTDDSGIGEPHLEATVGQYQIEYLNSLLTRLINERLD